MEPRSITLPAYAKVNLTLDVLSLRPDGYHGIATIMQSISLADRLTISATESGIELECSDSSIRPEQNLAYRAAEAILQLAKTDSGVRIQLEKRIPTQAGLGGGSSDAAATLRGIDALLGLNLSAEALSRVAAEIGSDVPFFLHGGAAACRGRGELVSPLPDPPALWYVIVKPDAGMSTADAYRSLDRIEGRTSARATRTMEEILAAGDRERITNRMTNDFEQAVFSDHMSIALVQDDLRMARARNARLCGSGSAVFGVAWSEAEALEIARVMRLKYDRVFICRALTRAESLAIGEPVSC